MTPVEEWQHTPGTGAEGNPTDQTEEIQVPVEIPEVEGMKEIVHGAGSAQVFGKWSRRLITIEKVGDGPYERPDFVPKEMKEDENVPGHYKFRERFYDKQLDVTGLKLEDGERTWDRSSS